MRSKSVENALSAPYLLKAKMDYDQNEKDFTEYINCKMYLIIDCWGDI